MFQTTLVGAFNFALRLRRDFFLISFDMEWFEK